MSKLEFLHDFVDIIYPKSCIGCQQPLVTNEELLCSECLAGLPITNFHRISENEVMKVFIGRCHLQKAASYLYFSKGGIVQSVMHHFKYKGNKEVGVFMGRMLARDLEDSDYFNNVDVLVPVPLHPRKLKKRGYNQSEVIASAIAAISGIPVSSTNLVRSTHSETQTKKTRFARWQNVKSIFRIKDPAAFTGKHIMLIDDVITTGSTLEACATHLSALEGTRVSVLTLAVAK